MPGRGNCLKFTLLYNKYIYNNYKNNQHNLFPFLLFRLQNVGFDRCLSDFQMLK